MPPKGSKKAAKPVVEEDVAMADAPVASSQAETSAAAPDPASDIDEGMALDIEELEQRIRLLPGSSDTAASFEFQKEDHTLGNALRYIIMKNPDVEFCGYSIPHPSEALMNIRIQTYKGTATEALNKGFQDLIDLCDIVADKFNAARIAHEETSA